VAVKFFPVLIHGNIGGGDSLGFVKAVNVLGEVAEVHTELLS
jgi:hypothetical protein